MIRGRRGTTLGRLTYEDLRGCPAWEATGETIDDDRMLVPARLTPGGLVSREAGEVWCRSQCLFANGAIHLACTMSRGDAGDGPLAWTVWNGNRDVRLLVPPAPAFVLAKEGPGPFARAFSLTLADVFPLVIRVDPRFDHPPRERLVHINKRGLIPTELE